MCKVDPIPLDPEKPTWFGLDLSPDRKFGALVATQKLSGERFNILEAESKQTRKFTKDELKETINIYKKKIKQYEAQ